MTNRIQSTWRSAHIPELAREARPQTAGRRAASVLLVVFLMAMAGAGGYGAYWYKQNHHGIALGAAGVGEQSVAQIVTHVGEHVLLPSGEQPTLATVSDVTKVKGQAFFKQAANGDKVLVYAQAKKAILYRPSVDKIIEIAPLTADAAGAGSAGSATTSTTK